MRWVRFDSLGCEVLFTKFERGHWGGIELELGGCSVFLSFLWREKMRIERDRVRKRKRDNMGWSSRFE